jgi:DNA-directed RNA polymerase I subunit RPA43
MADSFHNVAIETKVHLLPSRLSNVTEGVQTLLTGMLMKYNAQLGGVVMSYDKLKILDTHSEVFFDRPHVSFKIQARLLVFRPAVGSYVTGTVSKVEPDHVGLLVNGVFNAAIKSAVGLPAEFEFSQATNQWINPATSEAIEVGTQLRFKVVKILHYRNVVSFEGELLDDNTGFVAN